MARWHVGCGHTPSFHNKVAMQLAEMGLTDDNYRIKYEDKYRFLSTLIGCYHTPLRHQLELFLQLFDLFGRIRID